MCESVSKCVEVPQGMYCCVYEWASCSNLAHGQGHLLGQLDFIHHVSATIRKAQEVNKSENGSQGLQECGVERQL